MRKEKRGRGKTKRVKEEGKMRKEKRGRRKKKNKE